ncbi:hypothetical protein Y032_0132g1676 [Ancylostoma ceylanicum]|uniref:Glycine N-acyltransferase-like protein n=1 Tax=Ancylostoma ceylanicum TaxID=53326 RepID=A0A016T6I6_9BILA|nr:hypothetical protein Y032_0132g1676 [Ancylostoma ceylanicum]
MLAQLTSRESLERAIDETAKDINTIYFPFSIRGFLEESFPESPIRVFVYPVRGPRKYWFMIKDNEHIKPYCMLAQTAGTTLERREFYDCIREFRVRAFGALDSNRAHLIIGKEELVKAYTCLMRNVVCDLEESNLNLELFYMDEKQCRRALNDSQPESRLPDGYYFDEVDPLIEGDLINNTWQHAKDGDLEQTIAKLVRLPSICVRHKGSPVAFEMVDPAGFLNNQFVFPEHRRKGIGAAVESKLTQRCVSIGMRPFKTVSRSNQSVLAATYTSSQWTHWKENDRPVVMIFQEWTVLNR